MLLEPKANISYASPIRWFSTCSVITISIISKENIYKGYIYIGL